MRHARNCRWCASNLGECPDHEKTFHHPVLCNLHRYPGIVVCYALGGPDDRPNYSSPAPASSKSRDVQGGPPSPEIGEMQGNKEMTKTVAELVNEALAGGMEWFKPACIALIDAAVAEERARWFAWAEDLGYDKQELPK